MESQSDIHMKNTNNNITQETQEIIEDIPQLKNENIELDIVTEGKATVRLSNDDKSFSAFYNPAQVNKNTKFKLKILF
jgi:hypothetical protein